MHAFIVNVPQDAGVEAGQAVVDDEGLIGRVVSAGATASRVLLLTDLNSRVPVRVEPGGYRAIAVGDNSRFPKIEFLPPEARLSPGDQIVTSGHGGLMPPDLPVGIVVMASDGSPRLQTNSEFDRTSAVRLLQYDFPTQQMTPSLRPHSPIQNLLPMIRLLSAQVSPALQPGLTAPARLTPPPQRQLGRPMSSHA